jgi:hypothetical protein
VLVSSNGPSEIAITLDVDRTVQLQRSRAIAEARIH